MGNCYSESICDKQRRRGWAWEGTKLLGEEGNWGYYCIAYNRLAAAAAAAKSLQSCPTLCDPIDGSPPGSPIPGILQARTLERVAISFSDAWKWKVKGKSLSRVWLFATPWTAAHQAPLSMGFSRQEYWSGVLLLHSFIKGRYHPLKVGSSWLSHS